MSGVVCALRDVSLRRSERFTLRVPSLVIGPGLTVVRGANASGKSTLLQVLATALRHHHGTVTIGGREVAPAQARPSAADDAAVGAIRAGLGYLPQGDTTATRTRVFDHVDVLAVARDIAASTRSRQAQVAGALAAVGMAGLSRILASMPHMRWVMSGSVPSGVRSRLVMPVPPVVKTTWAPQKIAWVMMSRTGVIPSETPIGPLTSP